MIERAGWVRVGVVLGPVLGSGSQGLKKQGRINGTPVTDGWAMGRVVPRNAKNAENVT